MTTITPLLESITAHLDRLGTRPPAVRAIRRWAADDPALAGYPDPASLARTVRTATVDTRDRLVGSLLDVAGEFEWAELTVLVILAPRLSWILSRWARRGVTGADLSDLEADLVADCWAHIHRIIHNGEPDPDRPGLALVDPAWAATRNRRSRQRRQTERQVPLPDRAAAWAVGSGDGRPGEVLLAAAISDAHRNGRLGTGPARALFLTRVVGFSTAEAAGRLGTGAASVRALRSRAAHRLLVHAGLDTRAA